jgi:hypothetical protein
MPSPPYDFSVYRRQAHIRVLLIVRPRNRLRLAYYAPRKDPMVRASKAQLNLLEANLVRGGGQAPAVLRGARRPQDLPENVFERQITDFLAWRGFISVRQHVGLFTPYRVVKQLQLGQISFAPPYRRPAPAFAKSVKANVAPKRSRSRVQDDKGAFIWPVVESN